MTVLHAIRVRRTNISGLIPVAIAGILPKVYAYQRICKRQARAVIASYASQGFWNRNMKNTTSILHRILSACISVVLAASAESGTKDSFDLADANHDGKLSREEAGDYLVYVVFVFRDKNRDGRLNEKEWAAGDRNQIAAFKLRDANEDGAVTMEEAIVFGRRGGGAVALMRRADKNRDGKLDRAELEAYGHQP